MSEQKSLSRSDSSILNDMNMSIDTGKGLSNNTDIKIEPIENMKERLQKKISDYNKTKFTRYFKNHKWRITIIIICIIILMVCVFTGFPINGDIDNANGGSRFMSLLGYISANIFIVLLVTVLGIETLLSRTESEELKQESARILSDSVETNKNNPTRLKTLLMTLKGIKRYKYEVPTTRRIAVSIPPNTPSFSGKNDSTSELYNEVKNEINKLSLDDMPDVIEKL